MQPSWSSEGFWRKWTSMSYTRAHSKIHIKSRFYSLSPNSNKCKEVTKQSQNVLPALCHVNLLAADQLAMLPAESTAPNGGAFQRLAFLPHCALCSIWSLKQYEIHWNTAMLVQRQLCRRMLKTMQHQTSTSPGPPEVATFAAFLYMTPILHTMIKSNGIIITTCPPEAFVSYLPSCLGLCRDMSWILMTTAEFNWSRQNFMALNIKICTLKQTFLYHCYEDAWA